MKARFLKSKEKKQIENELMEKFGIESIPYLIFESGKEKIRAFSGSLRKEDIMALSKIIRIEIIGIYLLKKENNKIRLSFDSVHLFNKKIKKNIIDLTENEAKEWLKGQNIKKEIPSGVYILKNENDFIGCGISDGKTILNYVPKERRLKKESVEQ